MQINLLLDILNIIKDWHNAACACAKEWIKNNVKPIRLKAPYIFIY